VATLVDYRCDHCGAVHEVFAPSPVADAIACPDCGEPARRRFGLGGLLGVRPARAARDRLDRERATKPAVDLTAHPPTYHHHGHGHAPGDGHDHGPDHHHHHSADPV
jgi:putative FmdB family regulatory protein